MAASGNGVRYSMLPIDDATVISPTYHRPSPRRRWKPLLPRWMGAAMIAVTTIGLVWLVRARHSAKRLAEDIGDGALLLKSSPRMEGEKISTRAPTAFAGQASPPHAQAAPIRKGYICVGTSYGRLNNQIIAVRGGLLLAEVLGRTFVVPPRISSLFDATRLGHVSPGVVVPYSKKLCRNARPARALMKLCKSRAGCPLLEAPTQDIIRDAVKGIDVLEVYGFTLYRNAHWSREFPRLDLEARFYQYFFASSSILATVTSFIEEHFGTQEFAAVHLRWLEGTCLNRIDVYNNGTGKELCSPTKKVFDDIMQQVVGSTNLPIFVASDRQRMDVLESYTSQGALVYKGPCSGAACAVIDFEIAARSNFFVGVVVSTASENIAKLRQYRRVRNVGRQYRSVLSWPEDGVASFL